MIKTVSTAGSSESHRSRTPSSNVQSIVSVLRALEAAAQKLDSAIFRHDQTLAVSELEAVLGGLEKLPMRGPRKPAHQSALLQGARNVRTQVDSRVVAPELTRRVDAVTERLVTLEVNVERELTDLATSLRGEIAAGKRSFVKLLREAISLDAQEIQGEPLAEVLVERVLGVPRKPKNSSPVCHGFHEVGRTSARSAVRVIDELGLSKRDTLIQLGSGVGDLACLAAIFSSATIIGIEPDSGVAAVGREAKRNLRLSNLDFMLVDPRLADLSAGTIFYLDAPFYARALQSVVQSLLKVAQSRPIEVVTTGPMEDLEVVSKGALVRTSREATGLLRYRSIEPHSVKLCTPRMGVS